MTDISAPGSVPGVAMPVRERVAAHLGVDDDTLDALPTVATEFPQWQHIGLQAALDDFLADPTTAAEVRGVPSQGFFPPSLGDVIAAPHFGFGPLSHVGRAGGIDVTVPCLAGGMLLVETPAGRLVAWVRLLPDEGKVALEVKGESLEGARAFLDGLRRRMAETNPYRGGSLRVEVDAVGTITGISFEPRPRVTRDEIVLPPRILDAIDAHAVAIGAEAKRLRQAGRHLKRGLLLHGPPGTGKTLTVKYIASRLSEATLFVLTGSDMLNLKAITGLLAEMAPVVVVLDDVDLVAEDRKSATNAGSTLFDLLDAMDGMAEDIDVLFVCTSNRANALEEAIAARPGRIDQSIEVPVPNAECRAGLLELFSAGIDLRLEDRDAVIRRTEGVTASFVKELLRRATVMAVAEEAADATGAPVVQDRHVHAALDALLDPAHPLYRALLGVHHAPQSVDAGPEKQRGVGGSWCGI